MLHSIIYSMAITYAADNNAVSQMMIDIRTSHSDYRQLMMFKFEELSIKKLISYDFLTCFIMFSWSEFVL